MGIFVIIGGLIALIGGIWLIVKAFQDSVFWGICCLFIPMATLLFAVLHWEETKVPFLLNLGGLILVAITHFR